VPLLPGAIARARSRSRICFFLFFVRPVRDSSVQLLSGRCRGGNAVMLWDGVGGSCQSEAGLAAAAAATALT